MTGTCRPGIDAAQQLLEQRHVRTQYSHHRDASISNGKQYGSVKEMYPGDNTQLEVSTPRNEHGMSRRSHEAQCAHYSHEMPDDLKESVGRFVIRLVPLLYGGMFGSLIHDLQLALIIGAVISAGMDIAMGDHSVLRSLVKPLLRGG